MPWWSDVDWISADLGTETSAPAMAGAEVVFHLASSTYPSTSNSDAVFDLESNLVGSVRMLKAAVEYQVRRVIFISSGGTVYGVPQQNPIPETHPTDPICSYGIHKLAIEKYLYLFRALKHLDSVVLRVSNIYGEFQSLERPLGAVSHLAHRAVNGIPIEIWGDGTTRRDYIHVDDVVSAVLKSISYQGAEHLFNIGSGRSVSLNQLLDLIRERVSMEIVVNYKPARSFDVQENVLDITRAAVELAWNPIIRLENGLDRLIK
jgi:UDP-glucose 4-epimerase